MNRKELLAKFHEDVDTTADVQTLVCQKMLWDGYLEYQVFTDDRKVYSALFDNESGMFLSPFCEVIQNKEVR